MTVVMMASAGGVDSVFVAGFPVRRRGRLVGLDLARDSQGLEDSRDHLVETLRGMDLEEVLWQVATMFPVE